jgi:transcriptional regulator with XRE-family HTH domain
MSSSAVKTIRKRLQRFKGQYPAISEQSGLSYSWLSKFASGERGASPSFEMISKLQAALDKFEGEHTPSVQASVVLHQP